MDQPTKDILANMQLEGIVKLIGGTVTHEYCIDSKGNSCRKVIITYEDRKIFN
jgi:hypothetical protein